MSRQKHSNNDDERAVKQPKLVDYPDSPTPDTETPSSELSITMPVNLFKNFIGYCNNQDTLREFSSLQDIPEEFATLSQNCIASLDQRTATDPKYSRHILAAEQAESSSSDESIDAPNIQVPMTSFTKLCESALTEDQLNSTTIQISREDLKTLIRRSNDLNALEELLQSPQTTTNGLADKISILSASAEYNTTSDNDSEYPTIGSLPLDKE